MEACDAFILTTNDGYDPEGVSATRRWLEESGGRELYAVGLMPRPIESLEGDGPVQVFLDKMLALRGEKSLLYVSLQILKSFIFC